MRTARIFKKVMVLISSNLEVRFTQIKCLVKKVFVDVLTNFYQCDTAKVRYSGKRQLIEKIFPSEWPVVRSIKRFLD